MNINIAKAFDHKFNLPKQETDNAAGFDLVMAEPTSITIKPGERVILSTGFIWEIPFGFVGSIRPRSGNAVKRGFDILAGVVDSDYRGEVKVVLINHGQFTETVNSGDRIAQMVIHPVIHGETVLLTELEETNRGEGGFGSTGK